eukprot:CAMPEP_0173455074 /NCGR_PEP_ID=MMETSP1357-20121228/53586_1 /TAXON_ID=77926 /ORGANISM="Hemiselmis rufescens, Strain PCC563" /LENGTH=564 /DNA_ID=CAMNT_0014422163 /DNA_START=40 /DNA_END=1734 /DNA_ORIENTATION=-
MKVRLLTLVGLAIAFGVAFDVSVLRETGEDRFLNRSIYAAFKTTFNKPPSQATAAPAFHTNATATAAAPAPRVAAGKPDPSSNVPPAAQSPAPLETRSTPAAPSSTPPSKPAEEEPDPSSKVPPATPGPAPLPPPPSETAAPSSAPPSKPAGQAAACRLRVRKEYEVQLTSEEDEMRRKLLESVAKVAAPAIAKLKPQGLTAVIVDCVDEFADLCENLALSAAKAGVRGMVILTTTPKMCAGIQEALGSDGFCLDQTEPYKMIDAFMKKGLKKGTLCTEKRHQQLEHTAGGGYYATSHGSLGLLMVTRSYFWYEFTKEGVGIMSIDADSAFYRNPFADGFIETDRFSIEASAAMSTLPKHLKPTLGGECNLRKGVPNVLRDPDGVKIMCAALPPPYFATPAAEWWFERHTRLALQCQCDIQTDTTMDLGDFYPDIRIASNNTMAQRKVGTGPSGNKMHVVPGGSKEFHGALNMTKFEPLPPHCEDSSQATALRMLPMDFVVQKCTSPLFNKMADNGMVVALHANCATGAKINVHGRTLAKEKWLSESGSWHLTKNGPPQGRHTH